MEQEQKPHRRSFVRELVPDWRPTKEQKLWAVRIILVLVVLLGILTLVGWPFHVSLWDWLDLLIIPIVLALGGFLLTRSENQRNREIADERRQDDALQAYLDGMSQLLTDKERPLHRAQVHDSLSTVARARTLSVLMRLDGVRKGTVLQFLYESGLITKQRHVLSLKGANLSKVNLHTITLHGVVLNETNLQEANLVAVGLSEANLSWADLSKADLSYATLSGANLAAANLEDARLYGASLSGANLSSANLRGAMLGDAILDGANLEYAHLAEAQLTQNTSVDGLTMPNGQKFEDWVEDNKGRMDDEEYDPYDFLPFDDDLDDDL